MATLTLPRAGLIRRIRCFTSIKKKNVDFELFNANKIKMIYSRKRCMFMSQRCVRVCREMTPSIGGTQCPDTIVAWPTHARDMASHTSFSTSYNIYLLSMMSIQFCIVKAVARASERLAAVSWHSGSDHWVLSCYFVISWIGFVWKAATQSMLRYKLSWSPFSAWINLCFLNYIHSSHSHCVSVSSKHPCTHKFSPSLRQRLSEHSNVPASVTWSLASQL